MYAPGVTLSDRYRLEERIGGGGMGEVWRGTDEVLGRTIAVKMMLPSLVREPGFAQRFLTEARAMASINHPGVVDIHDYRSDEAGAFLVMEYVPGESLAQLLRREGALPPARVMAMMAQAAEALAAVHAKGIVHRDLKPGNLLVRTDGTMMLTDFGIARSPEANQLTATGAVIGTASYLSPEQALGRPAGPRVGHLRPRRRGLPVPAWRAAVRRGQPDPGGDETRPRGTAPAAGDDPGVGAGRGDEGTREGSGATLAFGHGVRRRRARSGGPCFSCGQCGAGTGSRTDPRPVDHRPDLHPRVTAHATARARDAPAAARRCGPADHTTAPSGDLSTADVVETRVATGYCHHRQSAAAGSGGRVRCPLPRLHERLRHDRPGLAGDLRRQRPAASGGADGRGRPGDG